MKDLIIVKSGAILKPIKDTPLSICKEFAKHSALPKATIISLVGAAIKSKKYTSAMFKADVNFCLKNKPIGISRADLIKLCKLAKIKTPKSLMLAEPKKKAKTTTKRKTSRRGRN